MSPSAGGPVIQYTTSASRARSEASRSGCPAIIGGRLTRHAGDPSTGDGTYRSRTPVVCRGTVWSHDPMCLFLTLLFLGPRAAILLLVVDQAGALGARLRHLPPPARRIPVPPVDHADVPGGGDRGDRGVRLAVDRPLRSSPTRRHTASARSAAADASQGMARDRSGTARRKSRRRICDSHRLAHEVIPTCIPVFGSSAFPSQRSSIVLAACTQEQSQASAEADLCGSLDSVRRLTAGARGPRSCDGVGRRRPGGPRGRRRSLGDVAAAAQDVSEADEAALETAWTDLSRRDPEHPDGRADRRRSRRHPVNGWRGPGRLPGDGRRLRLRMIEGADGRVDRPPRADVSSAGNSRTLQGHPSVIGQVALLLKESRRWQGTSESMR